MKQLLILLLAILGGTLGIAVRAECIDFSLEFDERDYQIVSSDGIVSIQSKHIEDIDLSDGPMIPKQNFKPYIAQGASAIQPYSIDDKIVSCELSAGTRLLNVSTQTSSDECASLLSVTDILGDTKLRQPIGESESTQLDLNGLNNGVYVITLTIDGVNVDSRRIMLK